MTMMFPMKKRLTLRQWIEKYPTEMSHIFDDVIPPYDINDFIYAPSKENWLEIAEFRYSELILLPIFIKDDETGNVAKIARMKKVIAAIAATISPRYKNLFDVQLEEINNLLSNWKYDKSVVGEVGKTGSLEKAGGESLTHGLVVNSNTPGATTTTYHTSTGENATPRYERDTEVSSTDPSKNYSGTDVKSFVDSSGTPYSESTTGSEESSTTETLSGWKIQSKPDEVKKIMKLLENNFFDYFDELISSISIKVFE